MSFNGRKYQFYLIFGNIEKGKGPWTQSEWYNSFEPLFSKLLQQSSGFEKTGIRVLEYKKEVDGSQSNVKLGRLKWDKKSHDKWTLLSNDNREFTHFESWTPIWTVCEKNNTAPDIYISIWNEHYLGENKHYQFDSFIVIAIAEDLKTDNTEIIKNLSKNFNAKRTVFNIRTWGRGKYDESETWKFNNWIQDTSSFGVYKKGSTLNFHDTKFEDIEFEPYWNIIE
ncbi:MAG: hypothetical protein E6767_16970 [Dysgonomonas sp.]|nr:hypothetical protein [Dysgonomonas sp.]